MALNPPKCTDFFLNFAESFIFAFCSLSSNKPWGSPGILLTYLQLKKKKKGVVTWLPHCHGDLLHHNKDRVLFSNSCCFLWYHNIANSRFSHDVTTAMLVPKTKKGRPCWCTDQILREFNSIIMETLPFVFVEKHGC